MVYGNLVAPSLLKHTQLSYFCLPSPIYSSIATVRFVGYRTAVNTYADLFAIV